MFKKAVDDETDALLPYGRHVNSKNSDWDCGLACVTMTLKGVGVSCSLQELRRLCPLKSIWSVDLAFLLRNYVEDFTYYTSFLGSRREYKKDKFYQETYDEDQKRVDKLFAVAKAANVHIVRMILPLDDYKRFLYCKQFAIISLVNIRLLQCELCLERKQCATVVCGSLDHLFDRFKGSHYVGHFITLINYDPVEDLLFYRDPAIAEPVCAISPENFERARRSPGTDNDCIVVRLEGSTV